MAVETLYGTEYNKLLQIVQAYYGSGSDQWVEIAKYGISSEKAHDILKSLPNVDIVYNKNGSVRSYVNRNYNTYFDTANDIAGKINSNVIGGSASPSNSLNLSIPSNTKVNDVTKELEMTSEIGTKVSTGQKVIGVLGNIGAAVAAVSISCTLGKTIDKALYNLNPDFWNTHDMETLNPDTWASITNSGSIGDNLFNILMGVDPDTNVTTAYIDQNAFAYLAMYLQSLGIFDEDVTYTVNKNDLPTDIFTAQFLNGAVFPLNAESSTYSYLYSERSNGIKTNYEYKQLSPVLSYTVVSDKEPDKPLSVSNVSKTNILYGSTLYNPDSIPAPNPPKDYNNNGFLIKFNNYEYYNEGGTSVPTNIPSQDSTIYKSNIKSKNVFKSGSYITNIAQQLAIALLYFSTTSSKGIDGVGNQDGAIIPDLSNANSISDVLDILKNTLPFLFDNAITNSVPQPDGSIKDYTYLPFTLPNTNNANDANPETGGQTQQKPQVDPDTSPDTLLDLINKLIGNKLDTPNTPDTGSGETPPSVIPTGSASALYKIYNPSQGEIDNFGTWLWSSSFVDQLLKVFNNPMESIIGLHKVYASPIIGGRSNIKVGYLDSGVSSNWVSNQYTKIDCGTINLQEYFGNVFDYSPYTNIELYLPCIGFVTLNVGDVMRSSLNITYTVDVLTGVCLAEIRVIRDGAGGVLYSYSGNCASQYPLSSGSYMGIVSSAIGVAGSIIGTVASGGSLAPLALGSIGSAFNAHTSVQHSGNLSGNSGVMGGKIPYLIISRPQTNMAENYQHLQGIPSNTYVSLSSCHGFTQVKNVNVENINAESAELDEIKTQLLNGVLI